MVPSVKRQALEVPGGSGIDAGDEETALEEVPSDDLLLDSEEAGPLGGGAAAPTEVPVDPYAIYGYPAEVMTNAAVQAVISSVAAEQGFPGVDTPPGGIDSIDSIDSMEDSPARPTGGRLLDDGDEETEIEDDVDSTFSRGRGGTSTASLSPTGTSKSSNKTKAFDEEEESGAGMQLTSKFGWTLLAALGASYFAFDGM